MQRSGRESRPNRRHGRNRPRRMWAEEAEDEKTAPTHLPDEMSINADFIMDNKDFRPDYEDRPCRPDKDACAKTGFEVAEVSLPVEILPSTFVGDIETDCCGEPKVECECDACGKTCKLVITQRVKIKIPFKVGIKAITGDSTISCSKSDRCHGRGDDD